ncbi:type II toxin-antitoxin system RelE/ParE family toxin [Mesorhizobium sp. DCY119]|uniref:type II toxin-antitoxin system RelE/ParE family toxin n=1 Tax=Mesorhizobium sp. DCY119 TaxID=2108445 RepID=UPI000E6B7A78|nr:type II toxin-antitoxin system RelE/ParE family toxin [Mesorhizobium sp. DCY119]RJG45011.1 type II toxin-antitoxin system RelE/ParE family toxin [Mesorhizobium sp. DCY119]
MRELRFSSEALDNLLDIAIYIATTTGSRFLAEAFVGELRQKCAGLASLPGTLGRERTELKPGLRSFAFKGYVIFFRYRDDIFEVVTVLEGHRDFIAYYRDDDI